MYNYYRYSFVLTLLISIATSAQKQVSPEKMKAIYAEVKTPYKYGLVIAPKSDSFKVDCPTVFRKDNNWYMTYIQFNGRGYETWLAKSKDLLTWQMVGRLLSFNDDSTLWDANQKAGYLSLIDTKWGGSYKVAKYQGKYWMSYFGGR